MGFDEELEQTLKHRANIRKAKEQFEDHEMSEKEKQTALREMNIACLDYVCDIAYLDKNQKRTAMHLMGMFMEKSGNATIELPVFAYLASNKTAEEFMMDVYKEMDMDYKKAGKDMEKHVSKVYEVLPELKSPKGTKLENFC